MEGPRPKRTEGDESIDARAGESDPPEELPAPEEKQTYIAVDGIEASEMPEKDRDIIEKRLTDFFLTGGWKIEGVRVITERKVIEHE